METLPNLTYIQKIFLIKMQICTTTKYYRAHIKGILFDNFTSNISLKQTIQEIFSKLHTTAYSHISSRAIHLPSHVLHPYIWSRNEHDLIPEATKV